MKQYIIQKLKKNKFLHTHYIHFKHQLSHNFSFHGDIMFERAVKRIGKEIKVTSIVETGTFLGSTTKLFARLFPEIPVYTCEIIKENYEKAKKILFKYPNIHVYHMSSPDFLNMLIKEKLLGEMPMFYLDAHWLDQWPLEQEIKIISKEIKNSIVLIDDFKIPGNSTFAFDSYKDKECSLDRINPNIYKKNKYNLFFPNYDTQEAFRGVKKHEKFLVGYPIIFINYPNLFKRLLSDEFFKTYFIDKSEMIEKDNPSTE